MRLGFFLAVLTMLGTLAAGPALAQPPRMPGVMPLDRILPGIRRSYPGEFYDADGPTPGPDGQEHYHLKWMTPDGRIVWLDADARTGRVLGSSPRRDMFDGPGPGRYFAPAPSYPIPPPGFGGPGFRGDGPGFRGGPGPWRGPGRGGYGGGGPRRGR
jgi:hypothetical protein